MAGHPGVPWRRCDQTAWARENFQPQCAICGQAASAKLCPRGQNARTIMDIERKKFRPEGEGVPKTVWILDRLGAPQIRPPAITASFASFPLLRFRSTAPPCRNALHRGLLFQPELESHLL